MKYEDAVQLFGENLEIDAADRRFLVSLVDPEVKESDILIRLEISFLNTLDELRPGATGGQFESIKSGRLSASLLVDWGILGADNGKEFLEFCTQWDPSEYYSKGSRAQKCLITNGIITGSLAEFTGPTGKTAAGFTRVSITGGKLGFSGGSSKAAKEFIAGLVKNAAPRKAESFLF